MKKNDVIFYKHDFFLVIKVDKHHAWINKIRQDGMVLSLSQKLPRETKVKKIEGAKRKIKIELPFADVNDYRYKSFVTDAKRCVYEILTSKNVEKNKKYLRHLSMRSCMIPTKGAFNNLASFCTKIGLKKPEKLYEFLADSILEDQEKRTELIECVSDKALDKVISNYMTFWPCWHGFNKSLDAVLEADFAMHMAEFKRRNSFPDNGA